MNTVVILDSDSKGLVNYKRMLASFQEQMECKYFLYPEEAIEYVANHPVAVLVCKLEMPVMSGKEVFEMVEMMSPSTIKIAITQVRDVAKTLDIINGSRVFKLIVKPFFLVEDLADPIQAALDCYELQENEKNCREMKELKLEKLNQRNEELAARLEEKRRKYTDICHGAVGVIKGTLNAEAVEASPEENRLLVGVCEELLQGFMRYYMFEERSYLFHVNYLKNLFHKPEEGCIFQIHNKTGQELSGELMQKFAYGMFLGGYLCQQMFEVYRTAMMIEQEESLYVLRMFCQYSQKGEVYKITNEKVRQLLRRIMEEIAKALSVRLVSGTREEQFAVKLYFESEVEVQ